MYDISPYSLKMCRKTFSMSPFGEFYRCRNISAWCNGFLYLKPVKRQTAHINSVWTFAWFVFIHVFCIMEKPVPIDSSWKIGLRLVNRYCQWFGKSNCPKWSPIKRSGHLQENGWNNKKYMFVLIDEKNLNWRIGDLSSNLVLLQTIRLIVNDW